MHSPRMQLIVKSFLIWGVITVLLGAYTRISDAGLGCPDWPGCFGQLLAPYTDKQVEALQVNYAADQMEVSSFKAWLEMVHRYAASIFGTFLIILGLYMLCSNTFTNKRWPGAALIALVVFQALLGMWTVTWKLHPLVVMGHLMGGLTLTGILFWIVINMRPRQTLFLNVNHTSRAVGIGLILLIIQLILGGWTSSTYSGVACVGFPLCEGTLWPHMNFTEGFYPLLSIGKNYQGGLFSHSARVAIQMMHRYWAFVVVMYFLYISVRVPPKNKRARQWNWCFLFVLFLQVMVGVLNIVWYLPISLAVLHNGLALLLLLLALGWYHTEQHQPC